MIKTIFSSASEYEKQLPFFMTTIGLTLEQDTVSRPAGFPEYHWLHCKRGQGVFIVGNNKINIASNTGILLAPYTAHEYFPIEEPWETHWLTFDGYAIAKLLKQLGFSRYNVFNFSDIEFIDRIFSDICLLYSNSNIANALDISLLIYKFIIELKKTMDEKSGINPNLYKSLDPVIKYIESNYDKTPTIEEMAKLLSISPQHLCRLFKQAFKTRPFLYLNKYRITKSKELMYSNPSLSVNQIAKLTGFNDTGYFCTTFKKFEGITPVEFKKRFNL